MDKKSEAIKRMEALNLHPNVIDDFKEGVVNCSEYGMGILYWLDEERKALVKQFETEHNALVYHCIFDRTGFGDCLSMLYVSDYEDEWELDNDDLREGYPLAYVYNMTDPLCSEFGSIGIEPINGGIRRTA